MPELLRPGKTERLVFDCPVETEATVTVLDGSGTAVATLWENEMTVEGKNTLYWDGQVNGSDVAPGTYTLHIALSGKEVQAELAIGEHAPELEADGDALLGEGWYLWVNCSTAGEITVTLDDEEILRQAVDAGETEIPWDGTVDGAPLPAGLYDLGGSPVGCHRLFLHPHFPERGGGHGGRTRPDGRCLLSAPQRRELRP